MGANEEKVSLSQIPHEKRGDIYWVRAGSESAGIVVATAWALSKPAQFQRHSSLYASCNWDSLITHPPLQILWSPSRARALAIRMLDQLVQELEKRPRPFVFSAFSGGIKFCVYKMFQVIDGEVSGNSLKNYKIARDCYAGQILDSSPVDFTYRVGCNFLSHPYNYGGKKRNAGFTWSVLTVGKAVNWLFFSTLEAQRVDMWITLENSCTWGPVLVFCSKDDELAPYEVIKSFSDRVASRGCKITLITWEKSSHVAHLRLHPDEYSLAVETFLSSASTSVPLQPALDLNQIAGVEGQLMENFITGSSPSSWSPTKRASLDADTLRDSLSQSRIPSRL